MEKSDLLVELQKLRLQVDTEKGIAIKSQEETKVKNSGRYILENLSHFNRKKFETKQ